MSKQRVELTLRSFLCMAFFATTGCALLPATGPSTQNIISNAALTVGEDQALDTKVLGNYVVVNLTAETLPFMGQQSQPSLLKQFGSSKDASASLIGIGDTVQISIWEAGSGGLFSATSAVQASGSSSAAQIPPQLVTADGTIAVPFIGRIKAAGNSTSQLESLISRRLADKAIDPQVVVSIAKRVSGTVNVMGGAGSNIVLEQTGGRLLDVIAQAGGIPDTKSDYQITVIRDGKSVKMPLGQVVETPGENIFIHAGDTIFLDNQPKQFTVLGSTGVNRLVPFGVNGLTLDQALGLAGGLLDSNADPAGVFLMRSEPISLIKKMVPGAEVPNTMGSANTIYRLDLRSAESYFIAQKIEIKDRDIIFIAAAPLNRLEKAIRILSGAQATANIIQSN